MLNAEQEKMFFYENNFAKEFDEKMNMYDLGKRLKVVFNELLTEAGRRTDAPSRAEPRAAL
jgi:hypothetical protein